MNDEISKYSGVADSYRDFPLSALRHLQSILSVEIEQRLHSFGITNVEKGVGSVGDVGGKNTVSSGEKVQEKNVLFVDFGVKRSKV